MGFKKKNVYFTTDNFGMEYAAGDAKELYFAPSPTPTPSNTPSPSATPAVTPTPTPSPTPVFSPDTVSDLIGWYDFSDTGNMLLSGDEIVTVYDKSIVGNNISSTSGRRPTLTADTITLDPSVKSAKFERSSGDNLANLIMGATTTGYTWFIVMDFDVTSVTGERTLMYMYDLTNSRAASTTYYNYGGEDSIRTQYPGAEFDNYSAIDARYPRTLLWSQVGLPNSPYAKYDAELNDNTYNSAISDAMVFANIDEFYLGTRAGIDFQVGEVLLYNRYLTPSEISDVETYLKNKWDYTSW